MGTSLDAYSAILHKGPRVGLWGHVDSYVARANPLDQALERWMVRRADQVFAYTTRGANLARRWGAAQTSVTSVMNTVDTKELETSLRDLECSPSPVRAKPITLGYIGGLDGTKRISLLAQALMALTMRGTSVKLVVGGQGPDAHLLDALRTSHDIDIRGYVSGVDKAKLLQEVDALVCPGRIGLVAVDALVAQKPILTTDYEFHAPEADYLKDGISMFSSPDSAEAYADLIESQPWRRSIPPADWQYPRIETMVENFRLGVLRMMNLEA
ncbi:MAG: hypothetical protein CMH36_13320 [Microbacterium sp.]|nr:hypothetical protein [Microbacterium sp.]